MNIFPSHKIKNENWTDGTQDPQVFDIDTIIGYPQIDVGTQIMTMSKLIDYQNIQFMDKIKIDDSIISFVNLQSGPDQSLIDRNLNKNFIIFACSYAGTTIIGEDSTWVQNLMGVAEN